MSLAVFAFAVEDMKARESVMTSARPWAFLQTMRDVSSQSIGSVAVENALLIAVQLGLLNEGSGGLHRRGE